MPRYSSTSSRTAKTIKAKTIKAKTIKASAKLEDWVDSRELNQVLNTIQTTEVVDPGRPPEFRASALPFCPLLHVHDTKQFALEGGSRSYGMEFYVRIGTVVHSLLQEFGKFSQGATLFGNWQCGRVLSEIDNGLTLNVCKCQHSVPLTTYDKLKVKCPHGHTGCKPFFNYQEIEVSWRGLRGHIDNLLILGKPAKRRKFLLDFKTTSDWLFEEPAKAIARGYYPSAKYIEQIESYAVLLKLLYDIDIDYYGIIYVSRQHPTDPAKRRKQHYNFLRKFTPVLFARRLRLLKQQARGFKYAQRVLQDPSKTNLAKLYATRPCKTPADYQAKMKMRFFGAENCPFHEDKSCYNGKVLKTLAKAIAT